MRNEEFVRPVNKHIPLKLTIGSIIPDQRTRVDRSADDFSSKSILALKNYNNPDGLDGEGSRAEQVETEGGKGLARKESSKKEKWQIKRMRSEGSTEYYNKRESRHQSKRRLPVRMNGQKRPGIRKMTSREAANESGILSGRHLVAKILIDLDKMAEAKKEENCLFCGIQDSSTEIVYQDDDYLAFRDIKPATSHHYLVIPKNHIKSVVNLTSTDAGLVRKLVEIGEIVLNNNSASVSDARFGFHQPPFNSIQHLHLHVISPSNEMSIFSKLIFRPDSYWFVTPSTLIEKLEKSGNAEKKN
ncbi:histidine triad nucleotide-binding protein 3 [Nephila pilipes]|uniref:Adenosine 5'-monophosphoramidase HINT3 n=1 Tax=Nephila pilipes TaxID=299642 RepID=A0A8X6JUS9_NEPPI|nr:histidine triad nucleotide-binding protein 3 [Nephila pilipes]